MSTRAYRINVPAVVADQCTWNCSRNEVLTDILNANEDVFSREDGSYYEIPIDALAQTIEQLRHSAPTEDISQEEIDGTIDALSADLQWAKDNDHDYIMYDCY